MAVSKDRQYTREFVYELLEGIKGKTLGEIDKSNQFARTEKSNKITGIAGDVIEQSVFAYQKDANQECDIEIDGKLVELKTTGVRVPKSDEAKASGKTGEAYNAYLGAKEGISITHVTFDPTYEKNFETSHFWEKSEHLLIVIYEYKSYAVVPASQYANFPIVDYCFNSFSEAEKNQLRSDWEIVRDYLQDIYEKYPNTEERNENLVGFTHVLRPNLLLLELVPGFKKRIGSTTDSYQKPRYRLKQTFVDYLLRGHFSKSRQAEEIPLKNPFSSFAELDKRCHALSARYAGKTLAELKTMLKIDTEITTKDFTSKCILKMFDVNCKRLNQIADFVKAGIVAKTITLTPTGGRTEDMKLKHIDFEEWGDRDIDFEDSEIYRYFCEHSFLCPIFCERGETKKSDNTEAEELRVMDEIGKTTFEGFKRFVFDEAFIEHEVKRTWEDSRRLIHENELKWEDTLDKNGNRILNATGSYKGGPNFPKSIDHYVFFRGGSNDSREESRTECVNGVYMLPQFFWLKGSYIANKLQEISYL